MGGSLYTQRVCVKRAYRGCGLCVKGAWSHARGKELRASCWKVVCEGVWHHAGGLCMKGAYPHARQLCERGCGIMLEGHSDRQCVTKE